MPNNGTNQGTMNGLNNGLVNGTNLGRLQGTYTGSNTGQPWDVDAWNYIQAIQSLGISINKRIWNNFVLNLKRLNIWDACDIIYPMYGGTSASHSINMKDPSTFPITWHGSVTHSSLGVKGDGSTGYGDTGWSVAANAVSLTQNNASCGVYSVTPNTVSSGLFFGSADGVRAVSMGYITGQITMDLNDGGWLIGVPLPMNVGLISETRVDSMHNSANCVGIPHVYTNNVASIGLPTGSMYLLSAQELGSPGQYSNGTYSFFYFGNGSINQQDLFTEVENLQVMLGRSAFGG